MPSLLHNTLSISGLVLVLTACGGGGGSRGSGSNPDPDTSPQPTASPVSSTPSPSSTASPEPNPISTAQPVPGASPSVTPTPSASADPSPSPVPGVTAEPVPGATMEPTPTASSTPTVTPEPTASPEPIPNLAAPQWLSPGDPFAENIISDQLSSVSSTVAADLDGDGDQDVLVSTSSDRTISWFENGGEATPAFVENIIANTTDTIHSVSAVDIDGDEDLDVIASSVFSNFFVWFENDGAANPSFTQHTIADPSSPVDAFVTQDRDGDGDLDILAYLNRPDELAWFVNDGEDTPSFTEIRIATEGRVDQSVYAADIDNDGDMDILTSVEEEDTVYWYENDGSDEPVYSPQAISDAVEGITSVIATDLDTDGDLDLVTTSTDDNTLIWFANDGALDPTFIQQSIAHSFDSMDKVAATDVDGDGDVDLLVTSETNDAVVWFENDGGAEPVFIEHVLSTFAGGASGADAADLNGDGSIEVLSALMDDDTVAWYGLNQRSLFQPEEVGAVTTELAVDSDGESITYSLLEGLDSALFTIDGTTGEVGFIEAPVASDLQDINADGVYQLRITASDGERAIHRLINVQIVVDDEDDDNDGIPDVDDAFPNDPGEGIDTDGDGIGNNDDLDDDGDGTSDSEDNAPLSGQSQVAPVWTDPATNAVVNEVEGINRGGSSVHAADMNNDGHIDMIGAWALDNNISWYENDGARVPTFVGRSFLNTLNQPRSVFSADVDGDGDMDGLAASANDNSISWFENGGEASPFFTRVVISDSATRAQAVYAIDFDGDGDMDVLSASQSPLGADGSLAWYENDGEPEPTFTAHVIATIAGGENSVFTADLDGDDDMDVISASTTETTIAWYENDGELEPGFTRHIISDVAESVGSVYAADIDDDGHVDIVASTSSGGGVAWYRNNGEVSPAFSEHVLGTSRQTSVHATDFDGDGDIDLLSTSGAEDTVTFYEHDGSDNPFFLTRIVISDMDQASDVYAADVTGDGINNMLTSAFGGGFAWSTNAQISTQVTTGETSVGQFIATDADGNDLTYGIVSGPDASVFEMDSATGILSFINAPDVSAPTDFNEDNFYSVWISVSDGFSTINRLISVEVVVAE